jgi:hypothetical protein
MGALAGPALPSFDRQNQYSQSSTDYRAVEGIPDRGSSVILNEVTRRANELFLGRVAA